MQRQMGEPFTQHQCQTIPTMRISIKLRVRVDPPGGAVLIYGGPEYDAKFPDGIPTSLELEHARLGRLSSGFVMYPLGHARNESAVFEDTLSHKWRKLTAMHGKEAEGILARVTGLAEKSPDEVVSCYSSFAAT